MNARSLGLLLGLAALAATAAYAVDKKDTYERPTTLAVGITGGDTPLTTSVSCAVGATATQLVAARTDRSRRKVCFENTGNITVSLGTSTLSASDFYVLGESTNSATSPIYCTASSGAFYCGTKIGASAMNVVVLEETQSIP